MRLERGGVAIDGNQALCMFVFNWAKKQNFDGGLLIIVVNINLKHKLFTYELKYIHECAFNVFQ